MSGLAGHLARQVIQVERICAEPPASGTPITTLDHFARSEWTSASRDDLVHVGIRERAEQTAAGGPRVLAADVRTALATLGELLPTEPADRVIELRGQWCLRLDDFLMTRLLELIVHTDDLAVSVGLPTPSLPAAATGLIVPLLAQLAARKHGPLAVVRALSRAERAPGIVAAF